MPRGDLAANKYWRANSRGRHLPITAKVAAIGLIKASRRYDDKKQIIANQILLLMPGHSQMERSLITCVIKDF